MHINKYILTNHGWRKKAQGPDSVQRRHLTSKGNRIMEIRQSLDHVIPTMGFPIRVRWILNIESTPRWLISQMCFFSLLFMPKYNFCITMIGVYYWDMIESFDTHMQWSMKVSISNINKYTTSPTSVYIWSKYSICQRILWTGSNMKKSMKDRIVNLILHTFANMDIT